MRRNKKSVQISDPFADTLRVRPICSGDTVLKKEDRTITKPSKTGNYKFSNKQISDYDQRSKAVNLEDKTGLQSFPLSRNKMAKTGLAERINIPRQLKKAPFGSDIKMISVDLPRFGRGQAIIKSKLTEKNENEMMFPNEFKSKNFPELVLDRIDCVQPANLLEEAQREIDISQNQLQKIQTILKKRNPEVQKPITKWNNFTSNTDKGMNSKERVISTLTTLNQKLNDMQQKYFTGKTTTCKPLNDFPNKLDSQSTSEVDIVDSDSDSNIQIEDKDKIMEHFRSARMRRFESIISEEKGTSVDKDIGLINTKIRTEFKVPTEKKAITNFIESNSDFIVSDITKNRILEKFHMPKMHKFKGLLDPDHEKYNKLISEKGQNFSTTVPDVILEYTESMKSVSPSVEKYSLMVQKNDSSGIDLIGESENNSYYGKAVEKYGERTSEFNHFLLDESADKLQDLLLRQDEKSSERINAKKSANSMQLNRNNGASLNEQMSSHTSEENVEISEVEEVKSNSSETHYFDCYSKAENPHSTNSSSTMTKKKVFYDNFGHYSNSFDRKQMMNNNNASVNSVPNLSGKKFVTMDVGTRSDKEMSNHTLLHDAVLKSDYLTKSFTIDASGNFSESCSDKIRKNKSDQFFNGALDFKTMDTKSVKNPKITRDMYVNLSKSLGNSFYKLHPPN